jgi:hypothetical protein
MLQTCHITCYKPASNQAPVLVCCTFVLQLHIMLDLKGHLKLFGHLKLSLAAQLD